MRTHALALLSWMLHRPWLMLAGLLLISALAVVSARWCSRPSMMEISTKRVNTKLRMGTVTSPSSMATSMARSMWPSASSPLPHTAFM